MPQPKDGSASSPKPRRRSSKPTNGHEEPSYISADEVARRAYELYQSRGGQNGSDFDDWIQAEAQLKQIAQTQPPPPAAERRRRSRAASA
jgi:Protein of unknown function (DUF2934)